MTTVVFQVAEDCEKVYGLLNRMRPESLLPNPQDGEPAMYMFRRRISRGDSDGLLYVAKSPLQLQLNSDSETRVILRKEIEETLRKNNAAYMVAEVEERFNTARGKPINIQGKIKRVEDIFIPDNHPALKILAKYFS